MNPDISNHNPDPEYIRSLLELAGLTQQQAADRLGISRLSMLLYVSRNQAKWKPVPYPIQFALEAMAEEAEKGHGPTLNESPVTRWPARRRTVSAFNPGKQSEH